jgi:hypothetical protein
LHEDVAHGLHRDLADGKRVLVELHEEALLLVRRYAKRRPQPERGEAARRIFVSVVELREVSAFAVRPEQRRHALEIPDDRVANGRRQGVVALPRLRRARRDVNPVVREDDIGPRQHAGVERRERVRDLEGRRG